MVDLMERMVIDCGVAVKWFVDEDFSDQARLLFIRHENGEVDLIAPEFILAEIGNVIWKKHLFQGMTQQDAQWVIDTLNRSTVQLTPAIHLIQDAYQIAVNYRRSVYDSLYLALSQREGCPFVTADQKLVNAVSPHIKNVIWLGDYS